MHHQDWISQQPCTAAVDSFNAASATASEDPLPKIPAMFATRLQLQLLLQDSCIDLKAVANVILSDAGATLQILRLVGEEYPEEESRPTRIEDCLVSLDTEFWYEAVCASANSDTLLPVAEWQRYRRVAECARELATCVDGFSPEEAYLVGLLYRLGEFPFLLGWSRTGFTSGEDYTLGIVLANHWHLPAYLLSAMQEQQQPGGYARWDKILELAYLLAEEDSCHGMSTSSVQS